MDVKSVDTLNYLLFHLRLGPPTFRPPLRLKFHRLLHTVLSLHGMPFYRVFRDRLVSSGLGRYATKRFQMARSDP